jgi:hypothetical protein
LVPSGAEIQRSLAEAGRRLRVVVLYQDLRVGVEQGSGDAVIRERLLRIGMGDHAATAEVARDLLRRGHDRSARPGGLDDAAVFVRKEEEELVALDWTSNSAAEVVVAVLRLGGGEEVAAVELVVAEELEKRSVHLVAAGTADDIDLRAGVAPELGRVGVAFDADLGDGIQVDHRQVVAVVRVNVAAAVEQPVIRAGLAAIEGEGNPCVRAEARLLSLQRIDTGLKTDQLGEAAGVQRELLNVRTEDRRADVGSGRIHLGDPGLHLDGFGDRADSEV